MSKNIEINYKGEDGGYEVLYPSTTPSQAGSLSIGGGTLTGPLMLSREPMEEMEAVNYGLFQEKSVEKTLAGSYVISMPNRRLIRGQQYSKGVVVPVNVFSGDLVLLEVITNIQYTNIALSVTGILYFDQDTSSVSDMPGYCKLFESNDNSNGHNGSRFDTEQNFNTSILVAPTWTISGTSTTSSNDFDYLHYKMITGYKYAAAGFIQEMKYKEKGGSYNFVLEITGDNVSTDDATTFDLVTTLNFYHLNFK